MPQTKEAIKAQNERVKTAKKVYEFCITWTFNVFSIINAVVSFAILFSMIDSVVNPVTASPGTWVPEDTPAGKTVLASTAFASVPCQWLVQRRPGVCQWSPKCQ